MLKRKNKLNLKVSNKTYLTKLSVSWIFEFNY